MVSRQARFRRLVPAVAAIALSACQVTPAPARPDESRPGGSSSAAARPMVEDDEFAKPVERRDDGLGDSKAADAVEILTIIGALFATGVDLRSETDPISATNRQDRTAAGVMGSAPNAAPEASDIVDAILKRFRDGDPDRKDPRGDADRADKPPPPPPPRSSDESSGEKPKPEGQDL